MAELSRNWITTPGPITDETLRDFPLTPRFAIAENHGLGREKIRLIDDCKISELNKTLEMFETSVPDSLNVALTMARTHSMTWRQLTLQLVIVDFSHAYKHIGIDQNQHFYAHIALLSPTGIPMHCRLNTQPFGSARAPANWARMTNAFGFLLMRLFALWVAIYVDDCYTIEPDGTAQSALDTLNGLAKILGLVLEPDKQVGPTITALLLGANISLEKRFIRVELPTLKAQALIRDMELILKDNSLSSTDAAKLRGRLGFSQSLLFARFGKALLQPITRRQYTNFRKKPLLNAELRYCMKWWVATLKNPTPRIVPLQPMPTIAVYSDAAGNGHLGVFIAINDSYSCAHTHAQVVPRPKPKKFTNLKLAQHYS